LTALANAAASINADATSSTHGVEGAVSDVQNGFAQLSVGNDSVSSGTAEPAGRAKTLAPSSDGKSAPSETSQKKARGRSVLAERGQNQSVSASQTQPVSGSTRSKTQSRPG
jgi:hypothetical protein